ncbi:uncharacterized protein LOC135140277 [Zophobas morio]|uniref:uncharacterized protein LOC135140277 n=1 Tax=Zophobas morio TaxID=2755281 RepID=UPI003083A363
MISSIELRQQQIMAVRVNRALLSEIISLQDSTGSLENLELHVSSDAEDDGLESDFLDSEDEYTSVSFMGPLLENGFLGQQEGYVTENLPLAADRSSNQANLKDAHLQGQTRKKAYHAIVSKKRRHI